MSAPMHRTNEVARICLFFDGLDRENSWILLDYSEHTSISSITKLIKSRHDLKTLEIVLKLKDCVLPSWESSLLLKDEDKVHVSVRNDNTEVENEEQKLQNIEWSNKRKISDVEFDSETKNICKKKKKKKKDKKKEDCNQYVNVSEVNVVNEDMPDTNSGKTKKKSKKMKSEDKYDILDNLKIDNDTDTQNEKTEKKMKKQQCPMPETELLYAKRFEVDKTAVEEQTVPDISNEVDEASEDTDLTEIGESQDVKPKRKRIRKRKHKPRNPNKGSTPSTDPNITDNIHLDKTNDSQGKQVIYQGRKVGNTELFYGSVPDKLESPRFYRHGYRNMKVYEAEPNIHKKFDTDAEPTGDIAGSVEQYNFLSSTTINADHDQYSTTNNASDLDQSTESMVMLENTVTNNALNIDNDSKGWNGSLNSFVQNGTKDISPIPFASGKVSGEQNTRVNNGGDVNGYSTWGSGASPAARRLDNGACVYTRPRRGQSQGNWKGQGFSKEEQLNTVISNKSTIFVNSKESPFKVPASPSTPSVKDAKKESHRTQHKPMNGVSPVSKPQSMETSYQPDVTTDRMLPRTTDRMLPRTTDRMLPRTTDRMLSGTTGVKDYSQCPPLVGAPNIGDKIAYKLLEMSVNFTPEVSEYKEAEVLNVDKGQMVTLKNLQLNTIPNNTEDENNKFLVEIEEDGEIFTNRQQPQEQVTVHISSMLDVRKIL